jgi:hypothetical protein
MFRNSQGATMPTTLTPELIAQVRNLSDVDRTALFEETHKQEYSDEELQAELQARWDESVADSSKSISMDEFLQNMDRRAAARKSS